MAKECSIQTSPINVFVKEAFTISLTKTLFYKNILLETSFGSNIIAAFAAFQCQRTDTIAFIRIQTFEIHVQGKFLHK